MECDLLIMNGEMNGAIEEPMETSPSFLVTQKEVSSKNEDGSEDQCDKPSNNDKTSNHTTEVKEEGELNDLRATNNKPDSQEKDLPSPTANVADLENAPCTSKNKSSDIKESTEIKSQDKSKEDSQNLLIDKEKSKDVGSKDDCAKINTVNEGSDEVDSEQDSSDEEGSVASANAQADTVSINSDSEMDCDETSQESHVKAKNEVIILDIERAASYNGSSCDAASPEIHEITSDNDDECIVTDTGKSSAVRFSIQQIKGKAYGKDFENSDDEDESDVEEVLIEDPLKGKTKPIVIRDAKTLVDIAKQSKLSQSNQKKETTVVIIQNNKGSTAQSKSSTQNSLAGANYRNPPAGVPISKSTANQNNQPSILPSLTDDMYVVEAPSFIVPYVYEKPSVKPFREFVDVLGRELEEQKAKEEKERLLHEKAEKEKKQKEKEEKLACGEEIEEESEEEKTNTEDDEAKKKKSERKDKRRRNEDDDASWDGESSSESEDEILSDEETKTVIFKDKADAIAEIKDVTEQMVEKFATGKSDNYFDCSLGTFFIDIGLNLVQEFVQTDLLKQQNRKLYKEKKAGQSTKSTQTSIMSLNKNIEFSKENNAPYTFTQKKCEFCTFKSESSLVLAHHLETPHMKNNVYKCNFCSFEIKSPHDILLHMDAEHHVKGRLERAPAYHQCANCPFEDNGKGKLARHLIPCAKKFKPELNLAPPVEWEPPAKIPKITRSRNTLTGPYGHAFSRGGHGGSGVPLPGLALAIPGAQFRARGRSPLAVPPVRPPVTGVPIIRGGAVIRHNTPKPVLVPSNLSVTNNGKSGGKGHQPSISITPLPRQPPPSTPQPLPGSHGKSSFVICEICDGYIKDLEQLRNHMQWIHRVKIHPKMIYNRPPLNCQKCQFRFFTDQGLERHLLGSHGLVTSSMQEAANKGKDAGRCPVCGRVYQWKLLAHVARDHNLTLKPAHLSYKCTVCTATFGMYKQFENHVYSAHSVVAKRVMDKGKAAPSTNKATSDSLLKPMKINDEITIIPQPVKAASSTSTKSK